MSVTSVSAVAEFRRGDDRTAAEPQVRARERDASAPGVHHREDGEQSVVDVGDSPPVDVDVFVGGHILQPVELEELKRRPLDQDQGRARRVVDQGVVELVDREVQAGLGLGDRRVLVGRDDPSQPPLRAPSRRTTAPPAARSTGAAAPSSASRPACSTARSWRRTCGSSGATRSQTSLGHVTVGTPHVFVQCSYLWWPPSPM